MYDLQIRETTHVHADVSVQLVRLADQLASVDRVTEQAFLKIGSDINDCYAASRGLAALAMETVELLQTDSHGETVERLGALIEDGSVWVAQTRSQSEAIRASLFSLGDELKLLQAPVRSLNKILKDLHALRISTRIEASRQCGHGTMVLGQELLTLAGMVAEKLAGIMERRDFLNVLCERALGGTDGAQRAALVAAGEKIRQARRHLDQAVCGRNDSAQQLASLNRQTADIVSRFEAMIAALQYQDITRQRLEHIRKALLELAESLRSDPAGLALVSRVGRLQEQQLAMAIGEFLRASDSLVENLSAMTSEVAAMAREAELLTRAGGHGRAGELAADLRSITTSLDAMLTVHRAGAQAIFAVCQAARDVVAMTEEIEQCGEEMQLLAQNATISAAHAPGEAAGLDVIAANIQQTAARAADQAALMGGFCRAIMAHADGLDALDQNCVAREADLARLLGEGESLLDRLSRYVGGLEERIAEICALTEGLDTKVCQTVREFTVREQFAERVGRTHRELLAVVVEAEKSAGTAIVGEENALLGGLQVLYTMKSERDVHRRVLDGAGEQEAANSCGSPFGDNVELF